MDSRFRLITGTSRARVVRTFAGMAMVAATAGACGGDHGDASADAPGAPASHAQAGDHPQNGDHLMADPTATPANKISGAEVKEATFTLLDTRPPGLDSAAGTAWLAQKDGTTVTITMTGLEPGATYISHLHAQSCAENAGGPHFQFDAAGPTTPPNEVHLKFTADARGGGTVTVTNDREVGDAARAIVIHPIDAIDNKVACADF
jgi:hypothetical protein